MLNIASHIRNIAMKISLLTSLLLVASFSFSNLYAADLKSNTKQPPARCKPNCDGIPAGKCSCVSIDHYTCCGLRTDGLKKKDNTNQQD